MNRIILLCFVTCLSFWGSAQSVAFSGNVIDTLGQPLDMVSVAVLDRADSTLESFTVTNPDGTFITDGISEGEYFVQISFLGYSTYVKQISVGENSSPSALGTITLSPELNVLSEVVINGQRIPVLINKDTVEYDASAFKVRADDNVEDLLQRLPGIEVDRDGTITAQGQEVEQVLVDGKEFFGGDPTVATRNIPADAVKSVQVYDGQTDDAKFTGVDDGERSKTINLELKEDRKNGHFGYAEGGSGVAEETVPYLGKAGIHSFTNTTRLSVLGNFNNINDYGFSFGDYRDMAGAASGGRGGFSISINGDETIPLSFGGPNDGQYISGAAGVNFNWDPNKKHRFNTSYFFTHLDNFTNTIQNSQEFVGDNSITALRESDDVALTNNHAFTLNHRSDLDSMNRIEIKGVGRYGWGRSSSTTNETRTLDGQGVLQESSRSASSENSQVSGNFDLIYTHKFQTKGRILQLGTGLDLSDVESDGTWRNNNEFPLDNSSDSLLQRQVDQTTAQSWSAYAKYIEPIAKKQYIDATVSMSQNSENLLRSATDLYSGGFRDTLSPDFQLDETTQSGRLAYRYTGDKHNIDIGFTGARYTQGAVEQRFETILPEKEYFFILPSLDYNWSISSFSRFGINYSASANLPELTQLLTLQDITNPLVKYVGNPDLEPQVRHNVWMNYGSWNSFDGSGFFGYISASRTNNVISTDQSIDSQYVRTFTPQNFSTPGWRINGSANYRFTVTSLGLSVRTRANAGYNQTPNSLNGELNIQDNTNVGGELGFRNTNQEIFGYSFGGEVSYNWSTFSLQENLNQNYLSHSYYANIEWTPTKQFGIETGVDLQNYTNANFAEDQFVPIWNANIRYNLLKEGTAQIGLTVFDILNQNRGINRYGSLNAITETQTNSLGRYLMVTFLYKFNSIGGGGGGNGANTERITIHR